MVRKVLNVAALAALASGVSLQASANPAPAATAQGAASGASTEAAAAAAAAQAAAPAATTEGTGAAAPAAEAAAAPAAAPAAAAAPSVAAAPAAPADVTAYLQGQIATKDTALLAAGVETAALKARVTEFEASMTGLMEIARASLTNMRVALGGHKTDLSALSATELLAQHEAAAKDFGNQFVAGGVAAVDAAQETNASRAQAPDSLEIARLNAVAGTRKRS